jgi:hypothetical protein
MGEVTGIAWTEDERRAARQAANVAVRRGKLARPDSLVCADCGATAREYDHYLGYAPEHRLDVQAVCSKCHKARDSAKAKATHCVHGHEFTPENTYTKPNGTRDCRVCKRRRDQGRRDAAWWRAYRARKAA